MGKFVVIYKEKVERSEHSELIKTAISLLIKHCVATELSTDEGIDERAEKKYPDAIVTINLAKKMRYIEGATEQSLIEQMKANDVYNLCREIWKSFAEWCSINGYSYSDDAKEWYHKDFPNAISVHCNMWYSTEELFNQFTNKKHGKHINR